MSVYFKNITVGIKTVFEGMSISLASFFIRPITVQYPEVDISTDVTIKDRYKGPLSGMPENYRGILEVNMESCTACSLCMKACPIDCIALTTVKCDKHTVPGLGGTSEAVKTRTCSRFDIDMGKCMFCGLCVKPCATKAIYHTNGFEMNRDTLDELVLRFVSPEEKEKAEKRGKEIEIEAAAKKAAKEAAKAAKPKVEKEKNETETTDSPQETSTDKTPEQK